MKIIVFKIYSRKIIWFPRASNKRNKKYPFFGTSILKCSCWLRSYKYSKIYIDPFALSGLMPGPEQAMGNDISQYQSALLVYQDMLSNQL